ncbi:hypothetical protein MKX01_024496 [Papaver californicum]|nr:hypothetical protein MKX01_024496 [Papaver californicum]
MVADNGRISMINIEPVTLTSGKKRTENSCDDEVQIVLESTKKRSRSQSECVPTQRHCSTTTTNVDDLHVEHSRCASASATYFHDTKTSTTTTWTPSTSPNCSLNTITMEDDIACASGPATQDDRKQAKSQTEAGQSHNSTRRSRVAAVHNQSERRRRDRINQKIRALQKLVPNSSKTDKASMLEEVVEYLKRLQAQIHDMMSINNRTTSMAMQPQMMMPMALQRQQQQHQLQMSLLAANMGMGLGMGVNPAVSCAAPSNAQIPPQPPFLMHPMMQAHLLSASSDYHHVPNAMPVEPYYSFLAQSMNMDLYNKMGVVYRQQLYHHENMAAQANSNATSTSQANHVRRHD